MSFNSSRLSCHFFHVLFLKLSHYLTLFSSFLLLLPFFFIAFLHGMQHHRKFSFWFRTFRIWGTLSATFDNDAESSMLTISFSLSSMLETVWISDCDTEFSGIHSVIERWARHQVRLHQLAFAYAFRFVGSSNCWTLFFYIVEFPNLICHYFVILGYFLCDTWLGLLRIIACTTFLYQPIKSVTNASACHFSFEAIIGVQPWCNLIEKFGLSLWYALRFRIENFLDNYGIFWTYVIGALLILRC